jgi:hypothetical protein
MPRGLGAGNGLVQSCSVYITYVDQFHAFSVLFNGAEVIGGDATAAHQS